MALLRRSSNGTKTQIHLSASYSAELSCGGFVLMYPMQLAVSSAAISVSIWLWINRPCSSCVLFVICRSPAWAFYVERLMFIAWPLTILGRFRCLLFWPAAILKSLKSLIFCVCWTLVSTAAPLIPASQPVDSAEFSPTRAFPTWYLRAIFPLIAMVSCIL
jgi:hypothetical protein